MPRYFPLLIPPSLPRTNLFEILRGLLAAAMMVMGAGCAGSSRPILYAAPSLLPHTTPAMNTPGFWNSRHPNPDAVILSDDGIRRFNAHIRDDLKLTKDLSAWPESVSGEELRSRLAKEFVDVQGRGLMRLNGRKPPSDYWSSVQEAMNLDAIAAAVGRQYGLVVRYANQRVLPGDQGLYAKAYDMDFDELQNSALDIGTPVVILHRSRDGEWLWVESSASAGWVHAGRVAAASEEQVSPFWSGPFVIVTAPRADIYLNRGMTDFYGSVLMGVRLPAARLPARQGQAGLPLTRFNGDYAEIMVPQRQSDGTATLVSAFVAADQVHDSYLPYTPRQVLRQAFKMINQPYGWGGMYGGQDCSRFLQEVFVPFGLDLPRDSKNQIQAGETLAAWTEGAPPMEKLRLLQGKGIGGATILGMKGHIMLYLGTIDGRPYAIHAAWAYRTPGRRKDKTFVLNRVVVSDLSLGEGSKRGSLLDRLNAVRIVK